MGPKPALIKAVFTFGWQAVTLPLSALTRQPLPDSVAWPKYQAPKALHLLLSHHILRSDTRSLVQSLGSQEYACDRGGDTQPQDIERRPVRFKDGTSECNGLADQ